MRILIFLGVLAVALVAWIAWHNPERQSLDTAARADVPMQFVGLGEGVTAYALEGPADGPWVVLVHGYSLPSNQWVDTVAALHSAGFRTLRFDLLGRGWSDRPGGAYTLERFHRQLNELLTAVNAPPQFHLVGLSMGGLISADFARRAPDRVAGLVLIAPFNKVPDVPQILTWPVIGDLAAHAAYFPRQAAMQARSFADPARAEAFLPLFTEQLPYRGFRQAILSTLRNVILKDPLPVYLDLGAQGRAVTLIWGEDDQVVPIGEATRLEQAMRPNTQLIRLPDTGHLPHLESPAATHAALIESLPEIAEAEVEEALPLEP